MTYEYEDEQVEIDENPDDKQLNHLIDEWLSERRPDRYDSGDKDWMAPVVDKASEALRDRQSDDEVIADAARRRVYQREGQATKQANKVLRDIAETEQLPLDWGYMGEMLNRPLSIDRKRVRLGAATAADLEQWELENHREEEKRTMAQAAARRGARLLGEWVRLNTVDRVEDLTPTSITTKQ